MCWFWSTVRGLHNKDIPPPAHDPTNLDEGGTQFQIFKTPAKYFASQASWFLKIRVLGYVWGHGFAKAFMEGKEEVERKRRRQFYVIF